MIGRNLANQPFTESYGGPPAFRTDASMRLTTIKLSGFKSFVDATTLHLPMNMTGVVGPNGCGKSNIIDAVRWVMGESSASRLRGDSLTDVIFSGSSVRKPVGSAMVELVFDNSDGLVAGEYAAFNEISVKRTVSRDGASQYFLNGSRCRRRDITDLFLGTGLGPRSYSIIEQGMISRVIDAKPEELRIYLEEAAGISKYKERRRETETRIRHTRENLERLDDVREEVGKQLEHLKRQARQAEQYQQLKTEQRQKDAELKALEYRGLDSKLSELRGRMKADELKLESLLADQRQSEAAIESGRQQQVEATEALNQRQSEVYQVAAEVARVEQQIAHQKELRQRLERAKGEAENAFAELDRHLGEDQRQHEALSAEVERDTPQLDALRAEETQANEALQKAEEALNGWQQRWSEQAKQIADAAQAAEVERTRIDYLDRQSHETGKRLATLAEERSGLDLDALASALDDLRRQHESEKERVEVLGGEIDQRKAKVAEVTEQQKQQQSALAETRQQVQGARGRLASLEALQHAALGQEKGAALDWLKAESLDQLPRAGEKLGVESGWEVAVENVLGPLLEGVLVEGPDGHIDALGALKDGRLALLAPGEHDESFQPAADSLAAKVSGPVVLRRLLADVFVAEDAMAARSRLNAASLSQSVITRNGEWLGHGWLRTTRSGETHGALARERDIQQLRRDIDELVAREKDQVEALENLRSALLEAEQAREETQRSLYLAHRSAAELAGQMQSGQGRLDSAAARIQKLDDERQQIEQRRTDAEAQTRESRAKLEQTIAKMADLESARNGLETERQQLSQQRDQQRELARAKRQATHELALRLESQRARLTSLAQSVERMTAQRGQLESRRGELSEQLAQGDAPVADLEKQRQTCLDQRVQVDRLLSEARSTLDGIENQLREQEGKRQQFDQQGLALREKQSALRLEEQALAMKAESLDRGIVDAGLELTAVIENLPENADASGWQQALESLENRIRRLEPVNLAAIQEFEEQGKRKEYLDSQHGDLTSALETLETAIRKIDRETRGRFKDTFDRVNSGLQELYPRLFGGGHAYLDLTGEDLLDTGVSIMARPPGKRVSNINLLSGGEKALTAVALVFSIFQLNPAPFCMLDEVDAPLDEANVGRFGALVRDMSMRVQFVFITHNKATMEIAEHLAGVTMQEPGVSRLVAVDVAAAARLAVAG